MPNHNSSKNLEFSKDLYTMATYPNIGTDTIYREYRVNMPQKDRYWNFFRLIHYSLQSL